MSLNEKVEETKVATENETAPQMEIDSTEGEKALLAIKPKLLAIPSSDVRQFKVNATSAVGIGLAYDHAYSEDRDLFSKTFNKEVFDPAAYDDMGQRAKGFWQADILMRQEINSEAPFRLLIMAAKPLRSKLMRAATYLWGDDPELGDVVAHIRTGNGHANNADDMGSLATLFNEHWDKAEGKCDVTLEDIAEAESLGASILQAMSPSSKEEVDNVRDLRNRAAEYLRRGIEELREGASYIYRNNPTKRDRYPSMFIRRRRKASNGKANGETASDSNPTPPTVETEGSNPSPGDVSPQSPNIGAISQTG